MCVVLSPRIRTPLKRTDVVVGRLLVAFKVYDMDRDGYISNGELFLVLKMMVGNNLKVRTPSSRRKNKMQTSLCR